MSRIGANIDALYQQRRAQINPQHPSDLPLPPPPQPDEGEQHPVFAQPTPTVTVFDGTTTMAPQIRLCMLAIGLVIVLLLAISIILIVSNQHKSHALKPGQISAQGNVFGENAFAIVDNVLEKHSLAVIRYDFRLSGKIQEWVEFAVPSLILETQKIQGFHVCCEHDSTWQCDSPLAFSSKLQQSADSLLLLVYTEALALANSKCVLEIKLLN